MRGEFALTSCSEQKGIGRNATIGGDSQDVSELDLGAVYFAKLAISTQRLIESGIGLSISQESFEIVKCCRLFCFVEL
ncbi:MAG: hypothetical protein HKUEN01_32390 [Candidatus Kuenenia stuttgartiensis]|nr:MAG: hypothetical protein HKUEN01_32390 [Candidatus Kuenenia stuttgartiensis]